MRGLFLAGALLAGAGTASADDWRITTAGYGPAKIGMTVAEASAALGVKLVSEGPVDEPACHYMRPEPAVEGLWFMISDDRVVRVEVTTAGITTRSGLGVGDSEARVKEMLPSAEVTPHKYVAPDGNYLTVWGAPIARRRCGSRRCRARSRRSTRAACLKWNMSRAAPSAGASAASAANTPAPPRSPAASAPARCAASPPLRRRPSRR